MKKQDQKEPWIIDTESNGQMWITTENSTTPIAQICGGELPSGKIEYTEEEKANAQRIVKAVNSFDQMREALKDSELILSRLTPSSIEALGIPAEVAQYAYRKVKAALKASE